MNRENLKVFKAIIIGGGMSGLVSAILLSKRFSGEQILLIEKQNRVAKKILSTGNGQCNISNSAVSIDNYHSNNIDKIKEIIGKYTNSSLIEFFKELGVLIVEDDNKLYPSSKQASSIVDALRFKLSSLKTNVLLESKAIGTNREKFFEILLENGKTLYAENLIIAVGGKSGAHFGTDGSSYSLLTSFGHTLTRLYPSLVQLKTDINKIKGMKGLKTKANVKAVVDGRVVASKHGEVLFTEYGVSGNAIFNISSHVVDKKAKLILDLACNLSDGELIDFLKEKQKACNYLTLEHLFSGIINNKIACACLRNLGYKNLDESISKVDVYKIVSLIKNYEIEVTGNMGFDNSQVTKGGIELNSFDKKNLESKLVKGLYAVGEVLDVDGDCGGYNLQWAYSSACAVCENIK